jgi:hypothetical protein
MVARTLVQRILPIIKYVLASLEVGLNLLMEVLLMDFEIIN